MNYDITHATDHTIHTYQCVFVGSFWPLAEHIYGCRVSCFVHCYTSVQNLAWKADEGEGIVLMKCPLYSMCVLRVVTSA